MDIKGITWVGNVYQKFEAMCLEVEEVMYQDTVTYVENQVQTVGARVNRFYSDVMQDFLLTTSFDAEKASPFCYAVEQDSDEGICKKTSASKKKEPSKDGAGEEVGIASLIHVRLDVDNLCRPSGDFANGARSGLRARRRRNQSKDNGSNFIASQNRGEEKLNSVETSLAISPERTLSRAMSDYDQYVNEVSEVQMATVTTPSINEDSTSHALEECFNDYENASRVVADLSNDFQSSNETALIESSGKDTEVPSSGGVLEGSNVVDVCLNDVVASVGGSSQSDEVRYDNYVDEETFAPQPTSPRKLFDWTPATDIKTANENEAETIQQNNRAKLEETIVVVNEDDLGSLPQKESKNKPIKKKLRDVLYSRVRSRRKQEYKQLALQYGDGKNLNHESGEPSTPTLPLDDTKKLPDHDSCESEWELL